MYLIRCLIILIPALGFIWKWKLKRPESSKEKECERFLFYCFMIPLIFHVLICASRIHLKMAYGSSFWLFFGVWLLLRFQANEFPNLFKRTLQILVIVETFLIIGFLVTFFTGKQTQYVYRPMRELGTECERIWNSRYTTPCRYMTGDWGLTGSAANRMKDRPSIHYEQGNWSTDSDLNEYGGMILWQRKDSEEILSQIQERFPKTEILPDLILPYKTGTKSSQLEIGVGIIPPQNF
jgi:hypothetical protein